ncbi:hypothetical protein ACQJBY_069893 [Aegilops geniculata]
MAVAAGLVWATLLMCVALGAGQLQDTSIRDTCLAKLFPKGSLPSPVRIYCRKDAALNVAIVGGNVVLANAKCNDLLQKWFVVYTDSSLFNGKLELKPFSLVNAQTFEVITVTIPSVGSSQKVGLYSPPSNPLEWQKLQDWQQKVRDEQWTPKQPTSQSTRTEGFYRLFVTKNTGFHLNGLGGVTLGTDVGIYSGPSDTENAIWELTSDAPLCAP